MKISILLHGILLFWIATAFPAAGATNLFSIIRAGNVEEVRSALKKLPPDAVHAKTGSGVTPLHLAAALNQSDIIKLLLAHKADINAKTSNGFVPLHWAAGRDAVDASVTLISAGADINAATPDGITPLHWAASRNATNVVKLFLLAEADFQKTTTSGMTPLHWAVQKESTQSAELIAEIEVTNEMAEEKKYIQEGSRRTASRPGEQPDQETPIMPVADPVHGPVFSRGTPISLALGMGIEMPFVWLPTMNMWVSTYEVSNGQYRKFQPQHSSRSAGEWSLDSNEQPVVHVNWHDAVAFCEWLNLKYGSSIPSNLVFRLPGDAEWTSFAQCGTARKYPWGNNWPPAYGNYSDVSAKQVFSDWKGIEDYKDGFAVTCPVQSSGTNEWGIAGLAGNVWEWCEDWSDETHVFKVRRGGSWFLDARKTMEISHKGLDRPTARQDTIGFRVVIAPPL